MKKSLLACALSLVALPVLADGFYAAGEVARVEWEVDSDSEVDRSFGLAAGYKFNKFLAVEIGYRDLGKVEVNAGANFKLELATAQASVLASYPLNDAFDVYGRLGMADLKVKASINNVHGSDSENKALYGVGARYAVSEKSGMRLEYNRYAEYEDITVSAFLFGIDVSF